MNSFLKSIAGIGLLIGSLFGSHSPLLKSYNPGNSIGLPTSSVFYVDANRSDNYTQTGNITSPYKTFSGAISSAASDTFTVNSFYLSPTNSSYVDGAPETMPNSVYINGNQSTWVPASGVTFPGSVEIYDTTIAGNLTFSATSTTALHQINNSAIVSGNVTAAGIINFIGSILASNTSTFTVASTGLMNFIGGQMNATGTGAAQVNFNDMLFTPSTTGYGWTQTGNAQGGGVNIFGMTYINTSGNGFNVQDGATGTPNNLSNFSMVLGANATSSVTAGTAATDICSAAGFYTVLGVFIPPTGSNWKPCFSEAEVDLNSLTVGTSTTQSNLTWIATPSSTVRIGVTSTWPGCTEMYDRNASATLVYMYYDSTLASSTIYATTTKPAFCQ